MLNLGVAEGLRAGLVAVFNAAERGRDAGMAGHTVLFCFVFAMEEGEARSAGGRRAVLVSRGICDLMVQKVDQTWGLPPL